MGFILNESNSLLYVIYVILITMIVLLLSSYRD